MVSLIRRQSRKKQNQRQSRRQRQKQYNLYGGMPQNNNNASSNNNNASSNNSISIHQDDAANIARDVPVRIEGNKIVLMRLYRVNFPAIMLNDQLQAYKLHPKNGQHLMTASSNTILVSELPEFQGYEFLVSIQRFPHGRPTEYIVTRIK